MLCFDFDPNAVEGRFKLNENKFLWKNKVKNLHTAANVETGLRETGFRNAKCRIQ